LGKNLGKEFISKSLAVSATETKRFVKRRRETYVTQAAAAPMNWFCQGLFAPRKHSVKSGGEGPIHDHDFAANTHMVLAHAGRILATVEGGSLPYEISDELNTVGPYDFAGTLPPGFAAHTKVDTSAIGTIPICRTGPICARNLTNLDQADPFFLLALLGATAHREPHPRTRSWRGARSCHGGCCQWDQKISRWWKPKAVRYSGR
jgi:Retinal pigment epithelial membrane protein